MERAGLRRQSSTSKKAEKAMELVNGKMALVTGASRGIGRGVAIELAREGAAVAVAARTGSSGKPARVDGDGLRVGGSRDELVAQIVDEVEWP
jgi:3-oxoacyl-[acyl-carrier protein] reductase